MEERDDDIILDLSDYEIVARVDLAICLRSINDEETWLPLSQISLEDENGIIRVSALVGGKGRIGVIRVRTGYSFRAGLWAAQKGHGENPREICAYYRPRI